MGQDGSWTHYLAEPETQVGTTHSHTVSLDIGVTNIVNTEIENLGPGPPSPVSIASDPGQSSILHCEEWLEGSQVPPKKRFRSEFGRLGRNIRQKLLCGFFTREGTIPTSSESISFCNIGFDCHSLDEDAPKYPNGCWEADPIQLLQQP